ncbi:MAG: hypothetical protein AAB721_01610 [Patescibacteria group bacterium]
MADVIGKIPEFTEAGTTAGEQVITGTEEEKEAATEEVVEEEKETPAEPPAVEKPAEGEPESVDTGELLRQVQGLIDEREKILGEIRDLRGTRRELKEAQLQKVEEKIDELKDLHPDDISVVDRILRAKGYITQGEAKKMFYEDVKNVELAKFLEKYPEYKPENDRNDLNWGTLERELGLYKLPSNPHQIGELLERAHRAVQKTPSGRGEAPGSRIKLASLGGGGAQRPSSQRVGPTAPLVEANEDMLRRGGWSEEEITSMKQR